jgi:hypothetical protein
LVLAAFHNTMIKSVLEIQSPRVAQPMRFDHSYTCAFIFGSSAARMSSTIPLNWLRGFKAYYMTSLKFFQLRLLTITPQTAH